MKHKLFLVALGLAAITFGCGKGDGGNGVNNPATASNPDGTTNEKLPVIAFEEKEFKFGKINAGDVVKHTFKFKNTGQAPLVVQAANASCGCTIPSWSKAPIEPGGSGDIYVEFNSQGKQGTQNKVVTVTANTYPANTELMITGEVVPAPEQATP